MENSQRNCCCDSFLVIARSVATKQSQRGKERALARGIVMSLRGKELAEATSERAACS